MSFRTVVITNQAKLNYKNRFLVVKQELEEKYIHLSEIDTVIIDSISVSISTYLLKELANNKINIILCDEKHNPFGEMIPYYSNYNTSKKIMNQSKWTKKKKDEIWTKIVENKIKNQAFLLKKCKKNKSNILLNYIKELTLGDKTNREGHAAKVYFNSLFGKQFSRDLDNEINSALNYGYAILLSTVNKEIANNGYITQLGVHHKNEFNPFNLTCDLMEPFRIVIDHFVYHNKERVLDKEYKMDIVNIFNHKFLYNKKTYTLKDIIKFYVRSVFDYIEQGKEWKEFIYNGEQNNESNGIF